MEFNNFNSIAMHQTTSCVPSIEQIIEEYKEQRIKLFRLSGFMGRTLIFDENGNVLVYNSEYKSYMLKKFNDIDTKKDTFKFDVTSILPTGTEEALNKLYDQFLDCIKTGLSSSSDGPEYKFGAILMYVYVLLLGMENSSNEQREKIEKDLKEQCIVF